MARIKQTPPDQGEARVMVVEADHFPFITQPRPRPQAVPDMIARGISARATLREALMADAATSQSNRLPMLAAGIRTALSDATEAATLSADHYMAAGAALIEAKAACNHGDWLAFLKSAGVNERSAQRYMRLAGSFLNTVTVSHLGGVTAALKFIQLWEEQERLLARCSDVAEAADAGHRDALNIIVTLAGVGAARFGDMLAMFPPEEIERVSK